MATPRWSLRRARLLVGTKLALVAGLVGFVVFAWIVEKVTGIDRPVELGRPVALAMSAIPAGLWLAFFYLFDRHEPEPKQLVAGVCVLGALVAAPLADFTLSQLAPDVALAQHGVSPFAPDRLVYAMLVVGLAQEMCKYAVVRYTIYLSPEFDEPMDGVVYMMSVGTGFAVWVNYHRLSSQSEEIYLSTGAAQAVITTLAHASFAGVLGYVLGRAKFTRRSALVRGILLFLGLLLAAALNGQFQLVEQWVQSTGIDASPWRGVGYAAVFAGAIFGLLMLASQRLLADSPFREGSVSEPETPEPQPRDPEPTPEIPAEPTPEPEIPEPAPKPEPELPEPPQPETPEPQPHDPEPTPPPVEIPPAPQPTPDAPITAASAEAARPTSRPRAKSIDDELRAASDADQAVHAEPPPRPPSDPAAEEGDELEEEVDDDELDEFDEDTAARRFGRRFMRATTDLVELGEELRGHYRRHDGIVIGLALVIVLAAAQVHRRLVTPERVTFDEHGLTFARSTAWLAPEPTPMPTPRLVPGLVPERPKPGLLPYHVVFTSSLDAEARLEVFIDERPPWSNLLTGLELDRRTRYGELYAADSSQVRPIEGHDWLRTEYHYAFVPEVGDQPRIGHAVEYATVDREHLYVITFHGAIVQTERMEDATASSLRVESRTGSPLLPHVGRLDRTQRSAAVDAAFASTAMVVVVDVVGGRLRAAGGASGIVIGADGSILTNYHVIRADPPTTPDTPGVPPHLHDLFVIGRYVGVDKPPQLVCAGHPSRSKYDAKLDLALLKCDTDLDGRAWVSSEVAWPALATRRPPDVRPLQRLWVLGYPDVGGGGLTLSQGIIEGWTGADGALGRDYLKTDAPITHGNSGGPVVDNDGKLIGIATAFRTRVTVDGGIVETAKVGLVRPLAAAENAIETVRLGWTPREGHSSFDLEPNAIEAPPEGVYLSTRILDAANDAPLAGALLMVLRPRLGAADVDMNRLDEQVLAWGRANAEGEVHLKQPVPTPGSYTVLAIARGYEPFVGDQQLVLGEDAQPYVEPWDAIRLQVR